MFVIYYKSIKSFTKLHQIIFFDVVSLITSINPIYNFEVFNSLDKIKILACKSNDTYNFFSRQGASKILQIYF